ncbi:hypothetical protein JCM10212_005801 [Sporobolomyces blumeae]
MADLVYYGLAWTAKCVKNKLADLRSPVIPYPPAEDLDDLDVMISRRLDLVPTTSTTLSSDAASSPSGARATSEPVVYYTPSSVPILTERLLHERRTAWKLRAVSLWVRQSALLDAKARGFDSCWAGRVTRSNIRWTRRAIVEAKWVADKLDEALAWCRDVERTKAPLRKVILSSTKGKRKGIARPIHDSYPAVLLELPYPIPDAPSSRDIRCTVPMPPSPEWVDENPECPPLYTAELDEKSGEIRLETVRWDPVPESLNS